MKIKINPRHEGYLNQEFGLDAKSIYDTVSAPEDSLHLSGVWVISPLLNAPVRLLNEEVGQKWQ